jgi:hypothetical protein
MFKDCESVERFGGIETLEICRYVILSQNGSFNTSYGLSSLPQVGTQ